MSNIAMVGGVLCVGWAALWFWLAQQTRAQAKLNELIERLEK